MKHISNHSELSVTYGNTEIAYELRTAQRKSLEIAVHPDKRVVVKAPANASLAIIEQKIRNRARWIRGQLDYFSQFDPRTPPRKYLGGESHFYLGRSYRLKIQPATYDKITRCHGYFYIDAVDTAPAHVKGIVDAWYARQAEAHLPAIFDACWQAFATADLPKPTLKLQPMPQRWGSLSVGGTLTLNVRLIQTPKECIEYVVFHELCHLIHPNHGQEFRKLLARTIPDWTRRKHKLEMSLA